MNNFIRQSEESVKILFISYDGLTDPLGRSQILPYFIGLSQLGFEIHILSFEKSERFKQSKDEVLSVIQDKNVIWHPLSYTASPPVFSTLFDLMRMLQKTKYLHRKYTFSLLHARSYLSALIALKMKKTHSLPFIFDMRGFWADERVEGRIWNLKNPIYKVIYNFFKRKEKQFLLQSDYNISLTHAGISEIKNWKGFEHIPFEMIPCCADLDVFNHQLYSESDKTKTRNRLLIPSSKFVISYLGSIGTWYMLDEMLDFFVELKKNKSNAHLLFISKESEQMLKMTARNKGVSDNDITVVAASRNEVPQYLHASDVNLFFIIPSFSKKASSPTKLAEALGMGIPVIANTGVGDVDAIIRDNKLGLLVQTCTTEGYHLVISNLDSLQDISKQHLYDTARALFSLESGVEKYANVYKRILERFLTM